MALTRVKLRRMLEDMDAPELRVLIEDLFAASTDNKRLLTAKLEGDTSELLGKFGSELDRAFRTSGRLPSMKVGGAKKALGAYVKVASPLEALDAELRYVEAGVRCLKRFGDWPENNYSSMEGVFEHALKRAASLPHDQIPFERLRRLVKGGDGLGYSYSFSDQLAYFYDRFLNALDEET